MKYPLLTALLMLGLAACEQASDSADSAARDLTGSHMVQQEKIIKNKLDMINRQQKQRMQDMDQQNHAQ
ncbi:MAG: hypothetical protein R8L58_04180 [Mariprofundaceae bacterium]